MLVVVTTMPYHDCKRCNTITMATLASCDSLNHWLWYISVIQLQKLLYITNSW